MADFDDILKDFDDIIPAGEFDDILGTDVPDEYKKESINKRLIESYERIVKKETQKRSSLFFGNLEFLIKNTKYK
jgi:hypothetical protein